MKLSSPRLIALVAFSIFGARARAQCPQWTHGFESTDLAGSGSAALVHDDGTGPSLYVGGLFPSAGDTVAANVARWDGSRWHAVGGGTNGRVLALAVFDDGTGPMLYASGLFTQAEGAPANRIARWDGSSWSAIGTGLSGQSMDTQVGGYCLRVFDDGSGPALYVGGRFNHAGGLSASGIARWDGTGWTSVAGGVLIGSYHGQVLALTVYDDGSGRHLVAGGLFDRAGTAAANNLARWDGSAWSSFGTGLSSVQIGGLAVFDEGFGPRLFAGGRLTSVNGAPASVMARWDGSSWSSMPGLSGNAYASAGAMFVHDDGSGPALWASASLGAPSFATFARWNGSSWTPITDAPSSMSGAAAYDEGHGARLFIVGSSGYSGSAGIAGGGVGRWDGTSWSVLHRGEGIAGIVNSSAVVDEASGAALYVGGSLSATGNPPVPNAARWDGSNWTDASGPFGSVLVLATLDDGAGANLYAGVAGIAQAWPSPCLWRLENHTWTPIGGTFFGSGDINVTALAEFDDGAGSALFVGGRFTSVNGVAAERIAKWDGSAWTPLAQGVSDNVLALKVWDDGGGAALYAGGLFSVAGGQVVNGVARWDGTSWSALAGGLDPYGSRVNALEVWNDGSGAALYVGGAFWQAGGVTTKSLARWNGSDWNDVGGGLGWLSGNGSVRALRAHDDGSGAGSALYVGGRFDIVGGLAARELARWDGTTWSALSYGTEPVDHDVVRTLSTYEDGLGEGAALYAAGGFSVLGEVPALNIARWSGCGSVGEALCAGDGSGSACPCGNTSALDEGRGCTHAFGEGARLRAGGVASLTHDSLRLNGDDMTPSSTCFYFQGTHAVNGGAGNVFGDGLRCAGGTTVRLAVTTNVLGASSVPLPGGPRLGSHGIAPGSSRVYQVWYRDAASFCTPSTFNTTNGLRVVWTD